MVPSRQYQLLVRFVNGSAVLVAQVCLLAIALAMTACGGGGSSNANTPTPQSVNVSVSSSSSSILPGNTQQFTATVTGTSNTAVTWSVNGVAGGNSTVGTIMTAGSYTAPQTVPNPYTINITATSIADPSKTGSDSVIIAGTIESTSQMIIAAQGGTISLPSGSRVTIPAGVLSADQFVTLSLVSVPPQQPPNTFISIMGPSLVLGFQTPLPTLLALRSSGISAVRLGNSAPAQQSASGTIDFSINVAPNTVSGLQGSVPTVDLIDPAGNNIFVSTSSGSYDQTTNTATVSIAPQAAQSSVSIVAGMANLIPGAAAPLGPQLWNGSAWVSLPSNFVPTGKVLVLTHGMISCVQQAFPCVSQLLQGRQYDQVVGFNYDYTQGLQTSGQQLAQFLDQLQKNGASQIDVEGHSEGGPVALSAISQAQPVTQNHLKNFVCHGCAIDGSPLALPGQIIQGLGTVLLNQPDNLFFVAPGISTFQQLLSGQFASDLVPNSSALLQIQQAASPVLSHMNVVLLGGTASINGALGNLLGIYNRFAFTKWPSDGVVGLDSALWLGNNQSNFTRITFPDLNHFEITCDPSVSNAVATALVTPSLSAVGTYEGIFFVTQVTDQGGGGCPSTATMQASAMLSLTDSSTVPGSFDFTGTLNIVQGPGLCDDYTGSYPFSGSIDAAGNTTFAAGPGTGAATGTFAGEVLTGTWSFSAGPGPDVGSGSFLFTKQVGP